VSEGITAAAGTLLIAGLALALGAGGRALPPAVTLIGVVAALFVLIPRAAKAVRRHPVLLVGALLVVLPVLLFALQASSGYHSYGYSLQSGFSALLPVTLIALAGLGGLVLLADDLRARTTPGLTPWQRLTGTAEAPASPPLRALGGLALILLSAIFALAYLRGQVGGRQVLDWLLLAGLVCGALAVVVTPVVISGFARADRGRVEDAREDERRRVAAHLHDSVLQTLALVQRQAHDPRAVARIARRQEHELRAWMAGEVELGSETLGRALRDAVAEVEDEHGATVEVTILGDRVLDRPTEELAAAAREALRNAARHAPGAPLFVFAQAGPDGVEVFVRDEGPGFDLATVPTERRGVRDSIIGRMAAVGGSAHVDSSPEGTEVALRI
jgi:signal transduction histidine kinase